MFKLALTFAMCYFFQLVVLPLAFENDCEGDSSQRARAVILALCRLLL